jgi:rhodanese-related sulfurtransferase
MSVRRVSPAEAHALMKDGYAFVDVRSLPEFEAGHPEGAYNVPLFHVHDGRMVPNNQFLEVVGRAFAKNARIVVGCRTGRRSLQAAQMLQEEGYAEVVDCRGGFVGETDMFGRLVEPGWSAVGLPSTRTPQAGRSYEELSAPPISR